MAIYKCSWEVEPGTTRNKFSEWSERVLKPGSPDLKASAALTTGPHCLLLTCLDTSGKQRDTITLGSLSTRVFETRTATGSELFSLLTCLHTTTLTLPSIFSPLEMISIKMWETPLSWNTRCSLPIGGRVSKTRRLKLPILGF